MRVSRQTTRGATNGIDVPPDIAAQVARLRGGGMPLPAGERALFEALLGVDLGSIRIHTDSAATQTARALQCPRLHGRARYRVRFRPVPPGNRQRAQAARPRARAYGAAAGCRPRGSRGFVGAMQGRRQGKYPCGTGLLHHHPRYPVASGHRPDTRLWGPNAGPDHRSPQPRETCETGLRHEGRGLKRGDSHIAGGNQVQRWHGPSVRRPCVSRICNNMSMTDGWDHRLRHPI